MKLAEKINQAIALEKRIKEDKRRLDGLKAELQSEIYEDMLNKNLKWKQMGASSGLCNVAVKDKLEIDSYKLLADLLGDVIETKVIKKEKVDYEIASEFKRALIALYRQDYRQGDLNGLLAQLGLDGKQQKLALKKLSGDYAKDKQLLSGLGVTGELEEELDLIHDQKNYELVSRYFDLEKIDESFMKKLKLALSVEDTVAIGLVAIEGSESGEEAI